MISSSQRPLPDNTQQSHAPRRAEDFYLPLKIPTASAGFEPANLGTKGQYATSRPPKYEIKLKSSTSCFPSRPCVCPMYISGYRKGKSVPLQAWRGPEGSRKLCFPDFTTTAQEGGKVVSLTHRPHLPPGNPSSKHFCWRLSRPQGHSAIGGIMSMKNSSDTIGNRTRDLPIYSTAL